MQQQVSSSSTSVRSIVYTAMFVALVFITTFSTGISIPLSGVEGLFHFGTLVMFTIAIKYGKRYGGFAGGFGMSLFNIARGIAFWAPGILVGRFLTGYVMGFIAQTPKGQGASFARNVIALVVGGVVMLFTTWLYGSYFLGFGPEAALGTLPATALQLVGASLGLFVVKYLPDLPENEGNL